MHAWRSSSLRACITRSRAHFSSKRPSSSTATQKASVSDKAFSESLLLPKTAFPLRNDPAKDDALRMRTADELYRWQWEHAQGPLFVFLDGPPYANGDLHMGHALNKILKDIINRYNVSIGRRVHYLPGWDCHGLPIENKVLKELNKELHELSPVVIREEADKYARQQVRSQLEQFRQLGIMADWSKDTTYRTLDHDYEIRQLRVFQTMVERGLIYRNYRPVHYSPSSRTALAEAELEYRDDHVSHSVYVLFDISLHHQEGMNQALRALIQSAPKVQLLVWTTTPWTLSANMAIAVNPEMTYSVLGSSKSPESGLVIVASERKDALAKVLNDMNLDVQHGEIQGSELAGANYVPLFSSLKPESPGAMLPILPGSHVTSTSGTGLVHCAPAHGQEDYALFRSLGLHSSSDALLCHVDGLGRFTSQVSDVLGEKAGSNLAGKEVLNEGGKAMVALLKELRVLQKIERVKHRYPYDWKTDKPVIVMATSQWFANLDGIKETAIDALKDVAFYPPQSRNRLESFVRTRSEWCISRQRVWGVPIPALYHIPTNRSLLNSESLEHILPILAQKGIRHWWDGPVEEFVPPAWKVPQENAADTWQKGTDTMDVWFDSGTSWSMLEPLRAEQQKGADTPTAPVRLADVCLEGTDQHRGWFQSQLLTAIGAAPADTPGVSPYGTLITNGMVLDENGKKMSKSLGNIVSPMTIINGGKDKKKEPAYGAEVLRLWAATVEFWRDMSIGPTVLAQCAESLRKIRNSARFILGNIRDRRQPESERVPRHELPLAERFIMHELYKLEATARDGYATYNFPKVVNALSNFANVTLSSLYFDITKDRLYANAKDSLERRAVVTVFEQVLQTMTSVMAPILPHLAEEIHHTMHVGPGPIKSVFTNTWTPLTAEWQDLQAESEMNGLLRIRGVVLALLETARCNKQLRSSLEAEVDIVLPGEIPKDIGFVNLLRREESFLKQLFIVSDAAVIDEGSLGTDAAEWLYTETLSIPGCDDGLLVRVRPTALTKCPRCWTYTRHEEETLCRRCSDVVIY